MPTDSANPTGRLAAALVGFAPAVVGYGLFAVLSRALYARGDTRPAALGAVAGWATVALAALALSAALPAGDRAVALTVANSVGMTLLAAALVYAAARGTGRAALSGLPRALAAGLVAAALATGAGRAVVAPAGPTPHAGAALWSGMLAGVVVGVVFAAAAWVLDRDDVGPLMAAAVRRLRRPGGGQEETRG
jgi:putative peptidoglycan lipid II flippase